jgi:excisionase family DNA binding protein
VSKSENRLDGAQVLPELLTAVEVAQYLRTTRTAIYAMASKGQLPGVVHLGRRLLFRRDRLVQFISESSVASPGEMTE